MFTPFITPSSSWKLHAADELRGWFPAAAHVIDFIIIEVVLSVFSRGKQIMTGKWYYVEWI